MRARKNRHLLVYQARRAHHTVRACFKRDLLCTEDIEFEEIFEKEKPTKQTSEKDTSEQETSKTVQVSVTQTTKVEAGPKSKTWVYASDPCSKALLPPVRGENGDGTQIVIFKFNVLSTKKITLEASTDCVVCTTDDRFADVGVGPEAMLIDRRTL